VSQAVASFVRPPAYYDIWQANEGIPINKVFHLDSLVDVELGNWERFGCRGAFVNLADPHITTAAILEVPPGESTRPVKHLFECLLFGVRGRGRTTFRSPGQPERSLDWGERSLFSPPLNTTYQHHNPDPSVPLRLLMVSNAPLILSLFHNERFVFDCSSVFEDRYDGRPTFFSDEGKHLGGRVLQTNFVPDALELALTSWQRRGVGAKSFHLSMAGNTMACHLSEFEVGTYKKAHRHGPGAHVVILRGEGYSLLWPEGQEPMRVDWHEGSMFSPPEWWYHQHFNTGPEPARYLALRRGGSPEHPLKIGMSGTAGQKGSGKAPDDREEAGAEQIEYEDEAPWIRELFQRELAIRSSR
jgi:hypothetical protein